MKKFGFFVFLIMLVHLVYGPQVFAVNDQELEGTVTLSGAWALYPMAVKWAEEFQKVHPKVRVDVVAGGAGKGMADALAGAVDIGMISRDIYPEEIRKGAWWIAVTKDAVVPTVNENNPVIKYLIAKGMKRDTFVGVWITGMIKTWGEIIGSASSISINVYTRSDACGAADIWAKYLGKKQEDLLGIGVYGDPGIAEAVRKDTQGIGFNNIGFAYDATTKKQISGIMIVPIDLNGNGRIDADENFYETKDGIVNAIVAGKYPSPPARDLYFAAKGKPEKKEVKEFMRWVLAEGQKYVPEAGYINLTEEKLKEGLSKLEIK